MRLRLNSAIDIHYQELIGKYKVFKKDVMEFKSIKMEMPMGLPKNPKAIEYAQSSNSHLLKELDDLKPQQQMNKVFQYINLQTKEILGRVLSSSKEVMQILTGVCVFYNQDSTLEALREVRNGFINVLSKTFTDQKAFVKTQKIPNYFSTASRFSQNPGMSRYPVETDFEDEFGENFSQKEENLEAQMEILERKRGSFSAAGGSNNRFSKPLNMEYLKNPEPPAYSSPPPPVQSNVQHTVSASSNNFHKPYKLKPEATNYAPVLNNYGSNLPFSNGYSISLPSNGNVNYMKILENVSGMPNLPESILCVSAVSSDQLVFGLRNGHLACFDLNTKSISSLLKGHNGGICSLASFQLNGTNMVASGSDHGDCSIILWNIREGAAVKKLEGHSAAVVAMVPLNSGRHLASASYDKEIIIWDTETGTAVQKASGHQSSITCISVSSDNKHLYSASLDGKIISWKLNFNQSQNEIIQYENTFSNDKLVCSLISCPFTQNEIAIGTKEGKVRIIDLNKGMIRSEISICDSPIIELLCVQSSDFESSIFIASALKCSSIFAFSFGANSQIKTLNLDSGHFIEFGCGISPKMQFLRTSENSAKIVSINQSNSNGGYGIWDLLLE